MSNRRICINFPSFSITDGFWGPLNSMLMGCHLPTLFLAQWRAKINVNGMFCLLEIYKCPVFILNKPLYMYFQNTTLAVVERWLQRASVSKPLPGRGPVLYQRSQWLWSRLRLTFSKLSAETKTMRWHFWRARPRLRPELPRQRPPLSRSRPGLWDQDFRQLSTRWIVPIPLKNYCPKYKAK